MQYFMRYLFCFSILMSVFLNHIQAQSMSDNFEGNGNITTWTGDDCSINTQFVNPFKDSVNPSNKVLSYSDNGGLYANVRYDWSANFNLSENHVFTLKIYVPSSGLTGSQKLQISLKLQDGKLPEPWSTQSEIIKTILPNQWQTVRFDFGKDNYINLNGGSLPPIQRGDFNRIVLQVNGENNTDKVLAYIDDFNYQYNKYVNNRFTRLVWSDEFNGNGSIDTNKWFHQTKLPNGNSWFNGEIQHYTNRTANSVIQNGVLKIIAKKENFTDQNVTKQYTSARLNSKFAFRYGRVEFRAKLPSGVGTWPALWTLGKNIDENGGYWDNKGYGTTPWPACGEIDIMEHWGQNQNYVQSALHTPSSYGNTFNLGGQNIPTASSAFHVYAVEWTENKMVFSVDSVKHYTYQPDDINSSTWPFNSEQYLLMNFAVQGNISSGFTQGALEVDYVRIYQDPVSNVSEQTKAEPIHFPNPFTDQLHVMLNTGIDESVDVVIRSADGAIILNRKANVINGNLHLNELEELSAGLYFIGVSSNATQCQFKAIKTL
jgi:beta-glucanase (GH16 family)